MNAPSEGDWMTELVPAAFASGDPRPSNYRFWRFGEDASGLGEPMARDEAIAELLKRAHADTVNAWMVHYDDATPVGGFRPDSPPPLPNWVKRCSVCQNPFSISGDRGGPFQESEPIICPRCGHVEATYRTAGVLRTYPLSALQAAEWTRRGQPEHP